MQGNKNNTVYNFFLQITNVELQVPFIYFQARPEDSMNKTSWNILFTEPCIHSCHKQKAVSTADLLFVNYLHNRIHTIKVKDAYHVET